MSETDATRMRDAMALQQLVSDYFHELDSTGGIGTYRFFTEDGLMDVGKITVRGHDALKAFYRGVIEHAKTADPTGARTTRHVVTNVRFAFDDAEHASVHFIVMNFSAPGSAPIFGGTMPTVVSDAQCQCVKSPNGAWRIAAFTGAPIFVGDDPVQNQALMG